MNKEMLYALGVCAPLLMGCGGSDGEPVRSAPYQASRDTVAVTGGVVSASAGSTESMRVFKGMPFAAPPTGALRWKAPQPVLPWSGVRRAESFSAACVMGNRPAGVVGAILYQNTEPQSEDCLYLNVWTGAASGTVQKRPVMVFVYGGGYQLGSGGQPNYDGAGLASKGAVVVTLNYRLGPLGFLAHPELSAESPAGTSGNYALMDVLSALQWTKANISAFGGDASNITLYSESAGSGLTNVLLASPSAAGLFQKAVLESFGAMPAGAATPTLAQAQAAGVAFASNLGAADIAALRAKPAAQIMAGAGSVIAPIVDGAILPDQLDVLFAQKKVNDVPLLLGWNADEATPYPPFATTLAEYNAAASARYGAYASQFAQIYPVASDADVQAMAFAPMRDSFFAWQVWTVARAHVAQKKSKTFLYHFTRRPPYYPDQHFRELDPPSRYGAYHALEQVYFYNNLDRSAPPRPYDATDRAIAAAASTYLVNFAAKGDPNGGDLPVWPALDMATRQALYIGDAIATGPVPFLPALNFYDVFFTSTLGRPLPF